MDSSFGIRADDLGRRGIVVKEGNYVYMSMEYGYRTTVS